MNRLLRLCGLLALLVLLCGTASSQISAPTISRVDIKHVGPPAASDEIIRGNIRINARLTAADPDRKLNFTITPPALTAEPGTVSFASIRINPRTRFLTGPPKLAPYKVNVHQDGLPIITVDGSMQQEGLIPPWLLPALIGLAALLLVLAILWFFLLKPSLSSFTKDQVASQTSSLQQQVNTLKSANPAPAAGGGGGATGPNPVKGDVWSSRLAVNSQATPAQLESSVTVPQGASSARPPGFGVFVQV